MKGADLIQLKNIVVKHFNESNWIELGALTNTMISVESDPRLLRSLSWGDSDYDGLALLFLRIMIGDDDENINIVQDYLANIAPESGENVSSMKAPGRKIIFSPSIFAIPSEVTDGNLIAAMMPFRQEMSAVYRAIEEAASDAGFYCRRADDFWDDSIVIQDVFSLIFQSYIVVCDFTGKNPNVFYEAGIAHTLGKHVVPITQSEQDIPFDLQHHRYAKYLNNGEGLSKLKQELTLRFQTLRDKQAS